MGEYVATRVVFSGAESGDFLAEGGSIQLTLTADGRTTGTMVVPASLSEDDTEVTLDLTGTYAIADDVVTFDHAADTFIRDSDWRADGNTLRAMETFGGTTIDAVLTKQ